MGPKQRIYPRPFDLKFCLFCSGDILIGKGHALWTPVQVFEVMMTAFSNGMSIFGSICVLLVTLLTAINGVAGRSNASFLAYASCNLTTDWTIPY
jgi:hypothetical protein